MKIFPFNKTVGLLLLFSFFSSILVPALLKLNEIKTGNTVFPFFSALIEQPKSQPQTVNLNFSGLIAHIDPSNPAFCTPATVGIGIAHLPIQVMDTTQQAIFDDTTVSNPKGIYTLMDVNAASRTISILPSIEDNQDFILKLLNGLSTFDIVKIQQHLNGEIPLDCPISKIIADFNFDGIINIDDENAINRVVLFQDCLEGCPPESAVWRFVPNLLIEPSIVHPDPEFTHQFWRNGYPNNQGENNFPFDAVLNFKGVTYTYLGQNSWLNEVQEWDYYDTGNCISDYGFWLTKSGDLSGNAVHSFVDSEAEYEAQFQPFFDLPNETEGDFELVVKVRSDMPLDAYQFGLKVLPDIFEIDAIVPDQQSFGQSLAENYNDKPEELQKGNIRTLWYRENGEAALDISTEIKIMTVKIRSLDVLNLDRINQHILMDQFLMEIEFISGNKLLSEEDIQVRIQLKSI